MQGHDNKESLPEPNNAKDKSPINAATTPMDQVAYKESANSNYTPKILTNSINHLKNDFTFGLGFSPASSSIVDRHEKGIDKEDYTAAAITDSCDSISAVTALENILILETPKAVSRKQQISPISDTNNPGFSYRKSTRDLLEIPDFLCFELHK